MASALEEALVAALTKLRDDVIESIFRELPFADGVLETGALPSHTHAAGDITSGTLATARLGSGTANSTKLLRGDSTWDVLASGDLPSHTHAAGDITSGTMATARLGSGTASATTLLFGDSTWSALVASDIPNLDASKITTGTMATARLGSGTASSTTALFGDQSYKTTPTGSGSSGHLTLWNGTNTQTSSGNLRWTTSPTGLGLGIAPTHTLHLGDDDAAKTVSTTWTTTSDARAKIILGRYERGLDFLRMLPSVVAYEHNGRFGTIAGQRSMNFIAQEVERVAPHWIQRGRFIDDGGTSEEVLLLNNHELQFALLNAILELDRRLALHGI